MKSQRNKLILQLLINSVVLIALYFLGIRFAIPMEIIYIVAGAALGIWFIIYNRGFATKGATPDMLPNTMSMAEKLAYIEEGKERLRKSRWVLTVLLPMIVAVTVDLIILFLLPQLEGLFS
ncbi:MAG: hypothetical protein IJW30_04235 [Clostridia bacterium]|nr:hypothetical protein [Clostridia bacterium]